MEAVAWLPGLLGVALVERLTNARSPRLRVGCRPYLLGWMPGCAVRMKAIKQMVKINLCNGGSFDRFGCGCGRWLDAASWLMHRVSASRRRRSVAAVTGPRFQIPDFDCEIQTSPPTPHRPASHLRQPEDSSLWTTTSSSGSGRDRDRADGTSAAHRHPAWAAGQPQVLLLVLGLLLAAAAVGYGERPGLYGQQ